MSTNFLCGFNVRLTLSVVTWPLFWCAQFVELRLWINTMYRLWDISLYSFSYGHYPELRERCQFKRQATQFIFEIMSKTTSSSKKRKYTVADAVDYVSYRYFLMSTKISCTNTTISTVWAKTAPLSIFPFAPFSTFTKTITIAIISILTGFSRGTRICDLNLWYDVYFSSIYLMSTSCVQLPTHGSTTSP